MGSVKGKTFEPKAHSIGIKFGGKQGGK